MADSQSQQNQSKEANSEQKRSNLGSQLKPSANVIAEAKKQEEEKQTAGQQQNQTQQAVQQPNSQVQKQPEALQNQIQKPQSEQSKEVAQNTKASEGKQAAQNQNTQQNLPKAETAKETTTKDQPQQVKQVQTKETTTKDQLQQVKQVQTKETTTKDQPQQAKQAQTKINEEIKHKCVEIFIRFQTNGYVEKNALGYAYRALGKVLTEQDIQTLINSIQVEKIGFDLFFEKYQTIQSRTQSELFDVFEALDIEKKGFVSLEILKNILLCEEKQLPAQDVELVLKELANGKGEVNYKELISKVYPSA